MIKTLDNVIAVDFVNWPFALELSGALYIIALDIGHIGDLIAKNKVV